MWPVFCSVVIYLLLPHSFIHCLYLVLGEPLVELVLESVVENSPPFVQLYFPIGIC